MFNIMYTIEDVVNKLQRSIKLPAAKIQPSSCDLEDVNDLLSEKVARRLNYLKASGKKFSFEEFHLVRTYEIGNITGNELLRSMIGILNNLKICKEGRYIKFTIERHPIVAIMIISSSQIEITTLIDQQNDSDRFLYSKLFDDSKVNENQNEPTSKYYPYFKKHQIDYYRANLPKFWKCFLKEKISQFPDPNFRSSFFGILFEIARTNANRDPMYDCFQKVPVASCVELAIKTNQSGRLQKVFGEHNLDVKSQNLEFIEQFQTKNKRYPTTEEQFKGYIQWKASMRMAAVKDILTNAIPNDGKGMWNEEQVDESISDIFQAYEIDNDGTD